MGDLVAQGLEEVLQRGARIGLDERLCGHSGNQPEFAEPLKLCLRKRGAHQIIRLRLRPRTRRLAGEIGGDMSQPPLSSGIAR